MSYQDELTQAVHRGLDEMTKATNDRFKVVADELVKERKEREALEAKLNRMGLSPGAGAGGGVETKDLHDAREAMGAYIKHGNSSKLVEMKAMSVGSDPNGGYIVLPALSASMNSKIFDQSPMKRLSRLETITSGDAWEEIDDHDEPDAEWVAEQQARNETSTPELGKLRVELHEIHASPKVTQKVLDTSYVDIGAWLEGKVADKFGRTEGVSFISGNGVGKPNGLLNGTPVTTGDATRARGVLQYFPSGAASTLHATTPADVFRNMLWGLRTPYRSGANWLMNSNSANAIDKIKNATTGDYLWRDSMGAGLAPTLLGYPVEFDENMPDIGADAFPVAFGKFKKGYVVVELNGIRVLPDPYLSKPNVIFYTYKRVGGGIAESEAIKLLKIAST